MSVKLGDVVRLRFGGGTGMLNIAGPSENGITDDDKWVITKVVTDMQWYEATAMRPDGTMTDVVMRFLSNDDIVECGIPSATYIKNRNL